MLFLDNVGDPGNLGAIIRSADAFGVSKIYISAGSADLYSPKTLRACMGSAFRVNAETECDIVERYVLFAQEANASTPPCLTKVRQSSVIYRIWLMPPSLSETRVMAYLPPCEPRASVRYTFPCGRAVRNR